MSWRWTYALEFSQNPRKIQRQQRKTSNEQWATSNTLSVPKPQLEWLEIDRCSAFKWASALRQRCWRSSLHCVRLLYLISLCFTLLIDFSLRYLSALLLCTASASVFFLHSPCFPFSAHTSFFPHLTFALFLFLYFSFCSARRNNSSALPVSLRIFDRDSSYFSFWSAGLNENTVCCRRKRQWKWMKAGFSAGRLVVTVIDHMFFVIVRLRLQRRLRQLHLWPKSQLIID